MAEASKLSGYDQEYLSLLARRKTIQAQKMGKKWFTTIAWLNIYLREKRPSEMIKKESPKRKIIISWAFAAVAVLLFLAGGYFTMYQKISDLEIKNSQNNFIPEEIIKVPNDEGNLSVYGGGKIKIGEEKILSQQNNQIP